jgi:hypothetical protein
VFEFKDSTRGGGDKFRSYEEVEEVEGTSDTWWASRDDVMRYDVIIAKLKYRATSQVIFAEIRNVEGVERERERGSEE